jgi:ABC-type bacteriocin/lantibiotic exporter with double-glycine peptidase domain
VIQLPDLRQQHDYDCGSVCCRIVWNHFKVAKKNTLTTEIDGTDPRAIESAMRISGLPVISGTMTLADLAWFTRTKRPVIVLATCSTEPIGHYMVCGGQRDRRLHFQCPSRGPIAETPRRFDKRWHDVDRLGTRYSRWGIVVG